MALNNDKVSGNVEFEGSSTKELEGSGSEEFKGSDSEEFEEFEEFEESSIKEAKALDDWFGLVVDRYLGHHLVVGHRRNRRRLWLEWLGRWFGYFVYFVFGLVWLDRIDLDFDHFLIWRDRRRTFEFGKSENATIDDFVLKNGLRWIPYNKFKNVEYLNEGGFGTVYKATWSKNNKDKEVILKCHKNLNENLNEFLKEWEYHISVLSSNDIIYFYGFTKDPNTSKYMVVMDYANKGNLRENLTRIVENNWNQKLYMLYEIISGLSEIHGKNLIHCDFHDGNILNHNDENKDKIYISDLGLCQPVKSFLRKYDIYGVIPFMAPEVLRGNSYTSASDIYSFSMIMWEFTSGIPPFNNRAYDLHLSLSICKGERPEIIENTPKCYLNLMKKCWNEDPLKRPSSKEVLKIIEKWIFRSYDVSGELKSNIMEFINAPIGHNNLATKSHPKACYTSRLLDFTSKTLNEILEDSQAYRASHSDLNDCVIRDSKSLDENTSKKLNEILESKGSQASVKANEVLVNEDLNDYIIKDLGSLDL